MTTVLRAIELIEEMNSKKRTEVREAVLGRIQRAVNQEIIDRLSDAVDRASDAGATDEEIMEYVQQTLRKRALVKHVTLALRYREASRLRDSKGRTD